MFLFQRHCFYRLNTSGLFLNFNKDITTRSDCQFILALILLAAGDPMVLDSVGPPLRKWPAPSHQGIMRWPMSDNFRYWDNFGLARVSPNPKIRHIRQDSMTLDVFFLHSQPGIPGKEFTELADAWWAELLRLRSEFADVGVATLATALDVGLSWMV
jgi:hypothetical protein